MQEFKNKSILVTGGTGSFGKECVRNILKQNKANRVVVFSRDEQKQYEMSKQFPETKYPKIVLPEDRLMKPWASYESINIFFFPTDFTLMHTLGWRYVPMEET